MLLQLWVIFFIFVRAIPRKDQTPITGVVCSLGLPVAAQTVRDNATPGLKVRCRLSYTVRLYLAVSHPVCPLAPFTYLPSRLVPFRCRQYVGKMSAICHSWPRYEWRRRIGTCRMSARACIGSPITEFLPRWSVLAILNLPTPNIHQSRNRHT